VGLYEWGLRVHVWEETTLMDPLVTVELFGESNAGRDLMSESIVVGHLRRRQEVE